MAKTLALINKDIAAHLAQKKIFTPPEAVELTRIYNQMGDLLNKPTNKINNIGMELDIYHRMLRRFMKLMDKFQFGDTPPEFNDNPVIPIEPDVSDKQSTLHGDADNVDDALATFSAAPSQPAPALISHSTPFKTSPKQQQPPIPPSTSPISSLTQELEKTHLISPTQKTTDAVMNILKEKNIASVYTSSGQPVQISIEGNVFPVSILTSFIKKARSRVATQAAFAPDELRIAHALTEAASKAGTETLSNLQKHIPRIDMFFKTKGPSHGTRRAQTEKQKEAEPDETMVSSKHPQTIGKPAKLTTGTGMVHLKRWQHNIDRHKKSKVLKKGASSYPQPGRLTETKGQFYASAPRKN